ncbi:MAG: signal peptide peptidase SppA [Salinarimonas sp.]|nr:signal peptide peptidase SppA [Salinarimonas sp.]
MASDAELIADRRRMRRKLSFWRVVGFAALIGVLIAAGWRLVGPGDLAATRTAHIARVEISGMITTDRRKMDMLERLGESRAVRGVILSINSPGGTVTGAEELYHALRDLAAEKPVVAFVEGTAASGAYIAAIASDHIVARETAVVGSIGTMFQMPNVRELLDNIGVSMLEVRSTPLKAAPSPTGEIDEEAVAALRELVDDTYQWFRDLVAERRSLDARATETVADGRVHTGRRALGLALIDAIGSEDDAVNWLAEAHEVDADLPIETWQPRRDRSAFDLMTGAAFFAEAAGFEHLSGHLYGFARHRERIELDGLLAIWQPKLEN